MEAEDGGVEVSAEIQSAGPGEAWEVALLRGDTALLEGTRTTDDDGEIDVDAFTADDTADAIYTATFTPAEGEATLCGVAVETDPRSGLAVKVLPVRIGGTLAQAEPLF